MRLFAGLLLGVDFLVMMPSLSSFFKSSTKYVSSSMAARLGIFIVSEADDLSDLDQVDSGLWLYALFQVSTDV